MSNEDEQEVTLATIKVRADAFARSPFWFTFWDIATRGLTACFWIAFWSIVAQCTCSGCIWGQP